MSEPNFPLGVDHFEVENPAAKKKKEKWPIQKFNNNNKTLLTDQWDRNSYDVSSRKFIFVMVWNIWRSLCKPRKYKSLVEYPMVYL